MFGLDYHAKNPDLFLVNQFENELNVLSHYETTGPEILKQTGGKVDAFCMVSDFEQLELTQFIEGSLPRTEIQSKPNGTFPLFFRT